MKTKEEIEQLANEWLFCNGYIWSNDDDNADNNYNSYIKGYTHCQQDNKDKKYTKEQIITVYWDAYNEGKYRTDKTAEEYYKETFIT